MERFTAVIAAPKFDEQKARKDKGYLRRYATALVKKVSKHYIVEPLQLVCSQGNTEPCLHVVRHLTQHSIMIAPFLVYSQVNWKLSQAFWDTQYTNICGAIDAMTKLDLSDDTP